MGQVRGAAWIKNLSLKENLERKKFQGRKTVLQRII